MSDQNHGNGSTSEEVDVLELEPTPEEANAQGGDPLDDIQDPVAKAEAKKNRAIARRQIRKGKDDEPAPKGDEPKPSDFLTKADFEKANERRAIREAQTTGLTGVDGEILLPPEEVKANWTEIQQFYSPRHGRDSAEDIAEDIKDAIVLFNARNGKKTEETAPDLISQPVVKSGGGENNGKTPPKPAELPGFKPPVPPSDWYKTPKKEGE